MSWRLQGFETVLDKELLFCLQQPVAVNARVPLRGGKTAREERFERQLA